MQFIRDTLSNGATLVRVPMPGVQSVTVLALVNAGRRYEPDNLAGISHFLEHMVFKGTAKYENAQVLSAAIDEVGGEFNAFTSKEYTGYYVKLASRHIDTALDVVSDMLCTPRLRQSDIDRESKVIVEEIHMYEDMPMRRVHDSFDELFFAGSNLEGEVLGTQETVTSLKTADFQQYLNDWYGFGNLVWVMAGDESVLKAKDWPERIIELLNKGGAERKAGDHEPFFGKPYGKENLRVITKDTEQAHFVLGFPSFSRKDARRYALTVLVSLLGKTMSSRLFTEIREKRGLCYYVRSQSDYYHDAGVVGASAGVDPKRVHEAIDATKGEFFALLDKKPVTAKEVKSAQQNIVGQLLLELEDSQNVAAWYGMRQLLEGQMENVDDIIKKIEAVQLDEVQSVARDLILEDQMRLALIGPFKKKDFETK